MANNVMDFKRRTKQALFYGAGEKCAICGFDEPYSSLYDFHHINPENKKFGLNTITCKLETTIEEAKKCIMVCPICHRKIHYNIIDAKSFNKSNFNEEKFWEKYLELTPQGAHQRAIADMKRPSREELKNLIRTQTFTKIAQDYNVSIAAIVKWCKKENLPYQKKIIKNISETEWEKI